MGADRKGPCVGIFYVVGKRLIVESTPLTEAEEYGDFLIHARSHEQYWESLQRTGGVGDDPYEQFPRGRVAYNVISGRFILLADRCIIESPTRLRRVLAALRLQQNRTEMSRDEHYRCPRCEG